MSFGEFCKLSTKAIEKRIKLFRIWLELSTIIQIQQLVDNNHFDRYIQVKAGRYNVRRGVSGSSIIYISFYLINQSVRAGFSVS